MSAEVQESGKKKGNRQTEEDDGSRRLYAYGGYEYVVDHFLYALYLAE